MLKYNLKVLPKVQYTKQRLKFALNQTHGVKNEFVTMFTLPLCEYIKCKLCYIVGWYF
uniref:Uncharacterized protein n=1 Tax=Ciona intestinalis TaxID=7719 RepID=H2XUF8_CIOIN